jgi:TolA-binding protein
MAGFQNFRSAFNGFKREDVVRYIEYMNNKHNSQVEQLNSQIQLLQAELAQSKEIRNDELSTQLESAQARCAQLEAQLEQCKQESASQAAVHAESELEIYRRAERTERMARERAAQIYNQANAVLSEATLKVDAASAQIDDVIDQVTAQLQNAQASVGGTKTILQDAVATLYAIRPEE